VQIVLHAGMHKTGTTSFQKWLADSRPVLETQGVAVFPTDPRILVQLPDDYDPDAIRFELAKAEKQGVGLAVFSHESLSECFAEDLDALKRMLAPHPIRYVITMRHWAGFLPSRWKQNCKRRDAQSFPAFAEGVFAAPDDRLEARFDLAVRRAAQAGLRDIRVVSYDFEMARNRLLPSLAEACLLPVAAMIAPDQVTWVNGSAGVEDVDRVRLFNGVLSRACGRLLNPIAQRSTTGLAPDMFYDLPPRHQAILRRRPDIAKRLDTLIDARRVRFAPQAEAIRDLTDSVTRTAAPFLVPEQEGHLFPGVEPCPVDVSTLEIDDVPPDLQQDIAAELRAEWPDLFG